MKRTVTLALERSTPGTHVYTEPWMEMAKQTFPTIYVKKHVFNGGPAPLVIQVTIEPFEGAK